MAAFDRNRWPPSVGIGGRYASDSAANLNISDPRDLFFILGPAPIALFAIKTGSLIQLYRWPFRYALYRDVLVIDEGTANLGPRTEAAIVERIGGLRGKKTIIAITHRPALVRNCDCI
jgi:hypothetical protein